MDAATTQANQAASTEHEDTSPNNFNRLTSPTVGKVALALAKAQGAFLQLSKNCEGRVSYEGRDGKAGGSYVFHYADLSAVVDATREALAANELAVVSITNAKLGILRVALVHSSGEWLASDGLIPNPTQVGPQRYGSAVTYAKRYQFTGLVFEAADDDDDANAAEGNQLQKTEKPKAPKPAPAVNTKALKVSKLVELLTAAGKTGAEQKDWMAVKLGRQSVTSSAELTEADLDKLIADATPAGGAK